MARALSLFLLVAVLVNYVHGHGWMVSPVPRSGGGTGTGNASTTAPCGGGTGSTPTATVSPGAQQTVQYMRANSHGATGNTVTLTYSILATPGAPTTADFTTNPSARIVSPPGGALMDVTINGPQGTTVTVPSGAPYNFSLPSTVVLQFKWNPTTGGAWYDCAFVTMLASGPDPCIGNGCPANSTCSGKATGGYDCNCLVGFKQSGGTGDATICTPLPPSVLIKLTLNGIVDIKQDTFTLDIARLLNLPTSRILYDRYVQSLSLKVTDVYFSITSDPTSGSSGQGSADLFAQYVRDKDPALKNKQFNYDIQSVQVEDQAPITYGQGPASPAAAPKLSSGQKAGIILGVIIGAAVLAAIIILVVIVVIKKKASGGSSKSNAYPSNAYPSANNNAGNDYYANQRAAPQPYR